VCLTGGIGTDAARWKGNDHEADDFDAFDVDRPDGRRAGRGADGVDGGLREPVLWMQGEQGDNAHEERGFLQGRQIRHGESKQAYYDLMTTFDVPVYAELKRPDGPFWAVDFAKATSRVWHGRRVLVQ
jgi:hypothetical protein